jgi:predicted DNA-binding transcriptional regulator AlpA
MSRDHRLPIVAVEIPQASLSQKAIGRKDSKSKTSLTGELAAENTRRETQAALADDLSPPPHAPASAPPRGLLSLPLRLLTKPEVLLVAGGVSYPTLWSWMRAGTFPRARVVGGKSMWRSDEVQAWLDALPVRPLKGDAAPDKSGILKKMG